MAKTTFTATIFTKGISFDADFYITATIEVEHFGSAEFIPPYNRPDLYDPGSGPEWSCVKADLFHDCGGDGEPVLIGQQLAETLREFVQEDRNLIDQVEEKIGQIATEDAE